MSRPPFISVVICTRDRAESLAQTLASLDAMAVPVSLAWEVVVIDNGAVPLDAATLPTVAGRSVQAVREPAAGLSHARNRGVAFARGDYICWTDDDVTVDRGWLAAYAKAFRTHPDAAVFGGPIQPVLDQPVVAWVARAAALPALAGFVAARDFGPDAFPLAPGDARQPWGANYAVRRDVQLRFPYDPALGASPDHGRIGEESEMIAQMLADDERGWWVPAARVDHRIGPERQTMTYFRVYFRRAGRTAAFMRSGSVPAAARQPRLASAPRAVLAALRVVSGMVERIAFSFGWTTLALRIAARREFVAGLIDRG